MRFCENNVLEPKYKDISILRISGEGLHGSPYIFCLLFIKMEKVQEHDLY